MRVTIRTKLMLLFILVGLIACGTLGFMGSRFGQRIITAEVYDQLNLVKSAKKNQIESYMGEIGNLVSILGQNDMVIEATKEFRQGYNLIGADDLKVECGPALSTHYQDFVEQLVQNLEVKNDIELYYPRTVEACYLQYEYIIENPNPSGEKDELLSSQDGSAYNSAHIKFHPYFKTIIEKFGFYDAFLIDLAEGEILYSVYKETDFATNLYRGPYRSSNLAKLVKDLRDNPDSEAALWVDFEPYRPSFGAPAAFVGVPLSEHGETIGALVLQLPIEELNRIMTGNRNWESDGLGQTGETYLVGEDYLMRSISRFFLEDPESYGKNLLKVGYHEDEVAKMLALGTTIRTQRVKTTAVDDAMNGKAETKMIQDYRGETVLSSYAPLEISGLKWVIIAEKDKAESMEPVYAFNRSMFVYTAVLMLLISLLALLVSGRFVKPIDQLAEGARKITEGETTHRVEIKSKDEFAELGDSFNVMVEELDKQKKSIAAQSDLNNSLLLNFVPASFVSRLKNGERGFADTYQNVSLVVVDIVGFSAFAKTIGATKSVAMLTEIMTSFDEAARKNHIERIKTIGDSYFAACGLFEPRLDHAKRVIQLSRELRQLMDQVNLNYNCELSLHISAHTGDVVAGVVGEDRFSFDVWGETVNRVFQMNNLEIDHKILVSKELVEKLGDFCVFENVPNSKSEEPVFAALPKT